MKFLKNYIIVIIVFFISINYTYADNVEWVPYYSSLGAMSTTGNDSNLDSSIEYTDFNFYKVGDILEGLIRLKPLDKGNENSHLLVWEIPNNMDGHREFSPSGIEYIQPFVNKNKEDLNSKELYGGVNLNEIVGEHLKTNNYNKDNYVRLAISTSTYNGYFQSPKMEYISGSEPNISVMYSNGIIKDGYTSPIDIKDGYEIVGGIGLPTDFSDINPLSHLYTTSVDGTYKGTFLVDVKNNPKDMVFYPINSKGVRALIQAPRYVLGNKLNYSAPNSYLIYKPKEIIDARWEVDAKYLNIGDNTKFRASITGMNLKDKKIIIRSSTGKVFYSGLYQNFTNEIDLDEGSYNLIVDIYNKENDVVYRIPSLRVSKMNMLNRVIANSYKSNLTKTTVINDFIRYYEDNIANRALVNKIKDLESTFLVYNELSPVLEPLFDKGE